MVASMKHSGSLVRRAAGMDLAEIAVRAAHSEGNVVMDAVGPDVYTFEGLVRLMADKLGSRAKIVHLRPGLAFVLSQLAGYVVRDVLVTRDEMEGLMSGLLVSSGPATAETRFGDWLDDNADMVGTRYASELARHYR